MSGIPDDIPDLGSVKAIPRQNPACSPDAGWSPEDYYVWTRCDGKTSFRDIILMVGLNPERTVDILRKLRRQVAVLLEGETADSAAAKVRARATPAPARAPTPAPVASRAPTPDPIDVDRLPEDDIDLGELSAEEAKAMGETVALGEAEKRRLIVFRRKVQQGSYFDVLGVDGAVGRRELKRAYYRMSKIFHPDRYYKRELGSFRPWLTEIFETVSRGFAVLSDDRQRHAYVASLRGDAPRERNAPKSQTREEHAAELFENACELEIAGQLAEAMKLFGAAIRGDPQPRYLRRAASAGIKAGELSSAEHYAKKAAELRPRDASYARVLADVYRAQSRFGDAERILDAALELNLENDTLARELRTDLDAVRRAQNRSQ